MPPWCSSVPPGPPCSTAFAFWQRPAAASASGGPNAQRQPPCAQQLPCDLTVGGAGGHQSPDLLQLDGGKYPVIEKQARRALCT